MRESEKYYIVPNWILYIGGGFTPRTGILAIIYSFCSNYGHYNGGTAYLSEKAGCTRRQVFRELHYLTKAGYIIAAKPKGETGKAVYTMNAARCEQAKQAYDIQSQADGAAYDMKSQADGAAYDMKSQADGAAYDMKSQAYDMKSQAYDMKSQDTINIISNSNSNRESAHAPEQLAIISGFPAIRISESELYELRKLDLTKTGKALEAYFSILEEKLAAGKEYPNHFATLRKWAMVDGATEKSMVNSSIDPADLDRLMMQAR